MMQDDQAARIGIDLGGTKIEGLLLGPGGAEIVRERIATPRHDYAATVAAISGLVARLESAAGKRASVGVGMPGSISPVTGLVQNANSTWLNGQPFDRDLAAALGREVRLANDANCFALSEAVDGAGAGARSLFGVILGTGCGGGLVVGGKLVDGPRGIGGEWGHNPLPWASANEHPGPQCWCGRLGCMEVWVSGPGLAADYARAADADAARGVETSDAAAGRLGRSSPGDSRETETQRLSRSPSAAEIAALAQAGDARAQAALDRHASRLARGLASVVNVFDPDVIVLGGGLSQIAHLYDVLPALMAPHIFADAPVVTIRPPRWGDAGGARGAAWLWGASGT